MTMLKDLSLTGFAERLASTEPVPGGGSAAARAGVDGAALIAMVASLTAEKPSFSAVKAAMDEAQARARRAMEGFIADVDADADAYAEVQKAMRLPKDDDAQRSARAVALDAALTGAAEVPRRVAFRCLDLLELSPTVVRDGLPRAAPDLGVAAHLLFAALRGALLNVDANIGSLADRVYVDERRREQHDLLEEGRRLVAEIEHEVRTKIG